MLLRMAYICVFDSIEQEKMWFVLFSQADNLLLGQNEADLLS